MSPLNLDGLDFKEFSEISNLSEKMQEFLGSLDEELKTWRDYVEKGGIRRIPHRIYGYACLDEEKIVAIFYFSPLNKYSPVWFWKKITQPSALKEARMGVITKKEYQSRGIASSLRILCFQLMYGKGYERAWGAGDIKNIARLKSIEKTSYLTSTNGPKMERKNGKIFAYWDIKKIIEERESEAKDG